MTSLQDCLNKFDHQELPDTHDVDGIAHCNKCNTPKQVKIKIFGSDKLMTCMCACEKAEYDAEQEALKKNIADTSVNHNRATGLQTGSAYNTFENAVIDDENRQIIPLCRAYADNYGQMLENNIGLKLWGGTGSGKSYMANCIFNRVIDHGFSAYFTTAGAIVNDMQKVSDKNKYIDEICNFDLLIIDDLGAERDTETAAQYIEDVVNRRMTFNMPLVITTNISDYTAVNMREKRLYSRLDGMMQSIKCVGSDRRRAIHADKSNLFKEIIKGVISGNGENMH